MLSSQDLREIYISRGFPARPEWENYRGGLDHGPLRPPLNSAIITILGAGLQIISGTLAAAPSRTCLGSPARFPVPGRACADGANRSRHHCRTSSEDTVRDWFRHGRPAGEYLPGDHRRAPLTAFRNVPDATKGYHDTARDVLDARKSMVPRHLRARCSVSMLPMAKPIHLRTMIALVNKWNGYLWP